MLAIDPDRSALMELLSYDPESGRFTWLKERVLPMGGIATPLRIGTTAGHVCKKYGRVLIHFKGRPHLAHRLAWLYVHGQWPALGIDHIDGDPSNNTVGNLRLANKSENGQNVRRARCNSKSGVLGVSWNKRRKKWEAEVTLGGEKVHRSYHRSLDEAVATHAAAKAAAHPFMAEEMRYAH